VTRPKSEYFANDPECHNLLPCALRSHRVAGLGGCPTGPPVGGVTSTSTPALCGPVPFAVTGYSTVINNNNTLLTTIYTTNGYYPWLQSTTAKRNPLFQIYHWQHIISYWIIFTRILVTVHRQRQLAFDINGISRSVVFTHQYFHLRYLSK